MSPLHTSAAPKGALVKECGRRGRRRAPTAASGFARQARRAHSESSATSSSGGYLPSA